MMSFASTNLLPKVSCYGFVQPGCMRHPLPVFALYSPAIRSPVCNLVAHEPCGSSSPRNSSPFIRQLIKNPDEVKRGSSVDSGFGLN